MMKLPEGWEWKKLGDIFKISSGKSRPNSIKTVSDNEYTYPVYGGNGILGYCQEYSIEESTIVIGRVGQYCGSIFISKPKSWISDNALYAKNFLIKDIDLKYLKSVLIKLDLNRFQKKSGQPLINQNIVYNQFIPLPPLPAQKKIVAILEKVEKLMEWRKEADGLINRFLESTFLEMFGDIEKNEKRWEKNAIKEVVIKNEKVNPQKDFPLLQFSYVDISSVNSMKGKIISTSEILGANAPSRAQQKIKTGDLLVSTVRPNLNAVALVPEKLDGQICSTGFCILRANQKKVMPEYLFMISISNYFIDSLVKVAKGASYPAVSNKDVTSLKIPIPPLELQNKFVNIFRQIEEIHGYQKQSEQHIENLFNVLTQKAFKGELV